MAAVTDEHSDVEEGSSLDDGAGATTRETELPARKNNKKDRHMQNLSFSLDSNISHALEEEHATFFDVLQWQQQVLHDSTRWGMCKRCLLCVESILSSSRHLYTSVVPCSCACVAQFYITGASLDPQKGLWQGILVGLVLSIILVSTNILITKFASIEEPLGGQKIYLAFSRCGRMNTLLALLLLSLTVALLISVDTQCMKQRTDNSPPCSLNQIFSGGIFN